MTLKFASLVLAAVVAVAVPAAADARPDRGGGGGGRAQREQNFERGDRGGRGGRAERPGRGPDGDGPPGQRRRERQNSLGEGWRQQQDEARRGVRQGRYVPLARVLGDIGRRTPGRQLDAGLEESYQGRPVYRVRWAARNGRRIDYIVDAQTGQVIGSEGQ